MVENIMVGQPFSDHNIITFDMICSVDIKKRRDEYYDYKKGNFNSMQQYLEQYDWRGTFYNLEANEKFEVF